jgi:hypothetical protein
LLPNVTASGSIQWRNAASIVITDPINEDLWLNSRLITTTSGNAYSQLITYLQANTALYAYYQPVTSLFLNLTLVNSSDIVSNDDFNEIGTIILEPTNSFAFVNDLINQLGSYGCDLGAFLQIYATSFDYISSTKAAPQVVSWNGQAPSAVAQWYQELKNCYGIVYDNTQTNGQGSSYFLEAVKNCYGSYAYVYKTSNSVYNVSEIKLFFMFFSK